jgi:hypothetical protein
MQERGASIKSKTATSVSFSQLLTHGTSHGAKIVNTAFQLRKPVIAREMYQTSPVARSGTIVSVSLVLTLVMS